VIPGSSETLTVQTAPGAAVSSTAQFAGGQVAVTPVTLAAAGRAAVALQVPLDAWDGAGTTVAATVAATLGGRTRTAEVSFAIALPRLALALSAPHVQVGDGETLTAVSRPGVLLRIAVRFPDGTIWAHSGRAGSHGTLTYRFTVPSHTRGVSGAAIVTATRLTAPYASVRGAFTIGGG
jgi:hypothetical protein